MTHRHQRHPLRWLRERTVRPLRWAWSHAQDIEHVFLVAFLVAVMLFVMGGFVVLLERPR